LNVERVLDSLNLDGIRIILWKQYHNTGPGRRPIDPLTMLKAQLIKYLLQIPSDRRLALRLRRDHRLSRACGFRRRTPSHGLFTQFRHRLGEEAYQLIFNQLTKMLIESGVMIGKVVAVDSQYSSENVRNAAEWLGAEPIIPVRRDSRARTALKVGRDFVAKGSGRVVKLFRKRWGIERLFGRAKNWLMLDGLRVRGLAQVGIHVSLSLISMLAVAVTAVRSGVPSLVRCIKRFVE
jgi:hypothetical protein